MSSHEAPKSLLDPLDEQLNHQTSQPFRVAGTTDHRFYDRHWLEAIHPSGEIAAIIGCGIYKNLGVCDGFISVHHQGKQYNNRFSRPLGTTLQPRVGPLAIEVLEPFRSLRVAVAAGEQLVQAELEWVSDYPPYLEGPHIEFKGGRLIQDTNRYDQLGHYRGWISVAGRRWESDAWWGVRDHSWGVRQDIGGYESPYGHERRAMLFLWTYAASDECSIQFQVREDGCGNVMIVDGELSYPPNTGRDPIRVLGVAHDIRFVPGTRAWDALTYRVALANGETLTIEATALNTAWAYRGTGYEGGYNDGRGVGVPRGELLETDVYDVSHPQWVLLDGQKTHPGHREQPARVTINGKPGWGHLPVMSAGRIERYDLGSR